jgi:hypothetical protein
MYICRDVFVSINFANRDFIKAKNLKNVVQQNMYVTLARIRTHDSEAVAIFATLPLFIKLRNIKF